VQHHCNITSIINLIFYKIIPKHHNQPTQERKMYKEIFSLEGTNRQTGERSVLHTFESKEEAMLWDNNQLLNRANVYIVGWYWKSVSLVVTLIEPEPSYEVIEAW
jgi:hypothetical protein